MEQQYAHDMVVALYTALADVQATMDELQDADIPYPDMRMSAHTAGDPDLPVVEATTLPQRFWSLSVQLAEQERAQAVEQVLRKHQAFAIGWMPAPHHGRKSADRGALAWRHYVFETPAASDQVADSAGTSGNTGITSSGVFASGAHVEGNPPARGVPEGDHFPTNAGAPPTTDDRQQKTATDERSRPSTDLKS